MADPLAFYRLVLAFPNVVSFNLRHISQQTREHAALMLEHEGRRRARDAAQLGPEEAARRERQQEILAISQQRRATKPYRTVTGQQPRIKKNCSFNSIPLEQLYGFSDEEVRSRVYDGIKKVEWHQQDGTIDRLISVFQLQNQQYAAKHIERRALVILLLEKALQHYEDYDDTVKGLISSILRGIAAGQPQDDVSPLYTIEQAETVFRRIRQISQISPAQFNLVRECLKRFGPQQMQRTLTSGESSIGMSSLGR